MYPYHNKIKQRIKNNEMVGYHYEEEGTIDERLVLVFNTHPYTRPIRPHRYQEYVDTLAKYNREKNRRTRYE